MGKRQMDILKNISDKELLFSLYFTQLTLFVLSVIFGIVEYEDTQQWLFLFQGEGIDILVGVMVGLIIVLIDIIGMKVLPPSYYDDGGINVRLFQHRSVIHIIFIAAVVAFCEELFFRGVLQTTFGWFLASSVFALVHFRYFSHWFLIFNIVLLSFFFGWMYETYTSLPMMIALHFTINFFLGLYIRMQSGKEETH
jgi:uncharacterized protein